MGRLSLDKRLLIHKGRWNHNNLRLSSFLTVTGADVRLRLRLIFLVLSLFLLLLERSSVVNSTDYSSNDDYSACESVVEGETLGSSKETTSAMRRRASSFSASIKAFILASPSLAVSVFFRFPPSGRVFGKLMR